MAKRGNKALNYFEAHPNKREPLRLKYHKGPNLIRQRCRRLAREIAHKLGVAANAANMVAAALETAAFKIRMLRGCLPAYKHGGNTAIIVGHPSRPEVIIDKLGKQIDTARLISVVRDKVTIRNPRLISEPKPSFSDIGFAQGFMYEMIGGKDISKYFPLKEKLNTWDQQDPGDEQPQKPTT